MGESKSISAKLMKEDLGRIPEWFDWIREATGVAHDSGPGYNPPQARTFNPTNFDQAHAMIEGALFSIVMDIPKGLIEAGIEHYKASLPPLRKDKERILFQEILSGERKLKCGLQTDKLDAMSFLYSVSYTYDTFTIMFNLLPALSRIQKFLTLQSVLLSESSHCSGESHPVASVLRKAFTENLVPWKGNEEFLSEGPAVDLFQKLRAALTEGHPVPPDFASFSQSYPSWDAFWQIAAWKAVRMETAIEAATRELLIEAWKCPEKPLSPTPPDPDMPGTDERQWDWVTERETTKPGIPRGGIRPFAYGSGHPVAEALWDSIWDAEHERRSYTDEIPLTFPRDLHTFRCPIPVDAKAVREIIDHPWRWAAEGDLPDFSGLWGGFSREAERLLSGKESVGTTKEGKEISWEDLRSGAESVYKRGIGMLEHLAGVQEHYRPLRAINPAEWRDTAEILKEESVAEMAGRAKALAERMK